MISNGTILYAPGLGQDYDILYYFREQLKQYGYTFTNIDFSYDKGELNPELFNCITNNTSEWWIGISLGASLLYYMYNSALIKPKRITIINPFSDREKLSIEKGFDLSSQWNFAPNRQNIEIEQIDLVSSIYDQSISMYHGVELINKAKAKYKNVIFVDMDHQIRSTIVQTELAKCLYDIAKTNGGISNEYKYCNLYQWKRDFF